MDKASAGSQYLSLQFTINNSCRFNGFMIYDMVCKNKGILNI